MKINTAVQVNVLRTIIFCCIAILFADTNGEICLQTQSSNTAQLVEVAKPDVSGMPILKPRPHSTNIPPKGMKNIPFVSPNPIPKPTADELRRGFILFQRLITQPVYRKAHPLARERIFELKGFATLGEYEPLTFSIYPLREMKNFRVIVSDLKSSDGTISKSNITVRLVTYWKMHYPDYTSPKTYREVPELLETVTVNSFKKGDCQRYWLTVYVPKNAKPGIYSGSVLLFDDISTKAIKLPVRFRVLGYSLIKDPKKHFSSFHLPYSHMYRAYKGKLIDKAITADFSNMLKYGYDIFPVFYLSSRAGADGKGEFYIKPGDKRMIRKAIELGFKGKLILVGGTYWFTEHYCPKGLTDENERAYSEAITKATKDFMVRCKAQGFPEQIYFPFDEPRAKLAKLSAVTCAAIKKAGGTTLITDRPNAGYNFYYHKLDSVDIWCSQPFAVSYERVIKDKRHRYWAYPNHVAGELKDRVIMQKGGRMTYGYGLWRSGYETLMPWAWRYFPGPGHIDQFNYFNTTRSGAGNRLDEQANFIPAIYWECFREGYDDGRYLYTLEQVMFERQDNSEPNCQALIKEGKELVNDLWKKILPEKRYLKCEFFNDEEFTNLRWRIADLTLKLLKYKGNGNVTAPSVLADTSKINVRNNDEVVIEKATQNKLVEYYDLGRDNFKNWHPSGDKELKFSVKDGKMILDLHIDHKHDGLHKDNKYPIGWPMVRYTLGNDVRDIRNYDFLVCKIKFVSDGENAANSVTKMRFVFRREPGKGEYNIDYNLGNNEDTWKTVYIPLDNPNITDIRDILLLPYEGLYPDGIHIVFTVSEIGLLRFRKPVIKYVDSVDTLLSDSKELPIVINYLAFAKGVKQGCRCVIKLVDSKGRVIAEQNNPLSKCSRVILDFPELSPGTYKLIIGILDKAGNLCSSYSKKIKVIKGYLE